MKIVLTAPPQTGKSSLVNKLLESTHLTTRGIYSEEKLNNGIRASFSARFRNGQEKEFMTKIHHAVEFSDRSPKVGAYAISLDVIENFIVPELQASLDDPLVELIYIDEIGRAQAHSDSFMHIVREIFQHASSFNKSVLATIVYEDLPWSLEYKVDSSVWLLEVTVDNRDALVGIIDAMLQNEVYLSSLSPSKQTVAKALFFHLLEDHQFVSAKKLFSNALQYAGSIVVPDALVDGVGMPVLDESADTSCYGVEEYTFQVNGKTDSHTVVFNVRSNKCQCDCPLSRGSAPFVNKEVCSHQLCVMIVLERTF